MKKTISILCAAALILASCGSKKAEKAESRPAIENSKKTEKAQKTSNS
ncbi:MAG: hypothetical protein J6W86_00990 [Bacteroidales bacterium]|nr:hypothetical protein [Bacteroidales bacterium]